MSFASILVNVFMLLLTYIRIDEFRNTNTLKGALTQN